MNVPAHYTLDGVCAACRGAIRITDARYTVREAVYHAVMLPVLVTTLVLLIRSDKGARP